MVDKELIENWRNMLKPSIFSWLLKTNYEGMGEQDKEEFERDFDEILDLAFIGLKHRAQLLQGRTEERTETHACDLISRQAAIETEPGKDVKPVAHAHWIPEYPNKRTGKAYWHKCSECGRSVFDNRQVSIDEMGYAFCPHCGAKMDEEEN